jgi:hypothetical protein
MAKKLSTLVIDATVNTSGIDKAVSSINNKLKSVKGSGGGSGRDGRFSAGVNPLQYVGGAGGMSSAAAGAAIGAAIGGKASGAAAAMNATRGAGAVWNSQIAQWSTGAREQLTMMSPFGSTIINRTNKLAERTREHHRNAKSMERAAKNAAPSARMDLLDSARSERIEASRLNRQRRALNTVGTSLGRIGYEAKSMQRSVYSGGLSGLIGTGGLIAGARYMTNFRQNVYGQFNDLDQFVGSPMFDAAKGLRNTGFANRSGQRTLTQSLMLGARSGNPNKPSILETGGGGIQDYYNNMFMGLGAFISDPLDTVAQSLIPGSPLRQMAGEDPKNLGWFASLQAQLFGTYQASRRNSV